ncbi:MAG: hypothetical protein OEV27_08745 [Nitrospira sp.]|nr:hypothetical protein [Nitrospira sp.]MDH4251263.1 hypothetical protein [Nitrospira sp.]MDH4343565.1 hypothetical protein [Nitrospira sp.]MDH5337854.1 hypothetical protein [Nitrospira sp.]
MNSQRGDSSGAICSSLRKDHGLKGSRTTRLHDHHRSGIGFLAASAGAGKVYSKLQVRDVLPVVVLAAYNRSAIV